MDKKSKKINQEIYWQQGYLTIRRKNWRRLMFTVCCVTVVILLSLLILNPFSLQTIQKQPQISIKQHAQTNKLVSSKYKSSRSNMNNSLSQGEIMGNKQQALSPSIADSAQSLPLPVTFTNSESLSLYAIQKLYQITLPSTATSQEPVVINQAKSKITIANDSTSNLTNDASVTNKTFMTDAQASSIAGKNIFTRQVINSEKMPLAISKNKNISHTNNSFDRRRLPDQLTQGRSVTKPTTSNKKQANDLSHSLTLQVASLHDPIQAQSIKAKLNSKGFPSRVEEFKLGRHMLYRVRVGTYNSRKDAHEVANKLKAAGYYPNISGQ